VFSAVQLNGCVARTPKAIRPGPKTTKNVSRLYTHLLRTTRPRSCGCVISAPAGEIERTFSCTFHLLLRCSHFGLRGLGLAEQEASRDSDDDLLADTIHKTRTRDSRAQLVSAVAPRSLDPAHSFSCVLEQRKQRPGDRQDSGAYRISNCCFYTGRPPKNLGGRSPIPVFIRP